VGDGTHGTNRFTGVAANADFGVDQMLIDDAGFSDLHGCVS
jgi:hypothetical protein